MHFKVEIFALQPAAENTKIKHFIRITKSNRKFHQLYLFNHSYTKSLAFIHILMKLILVLFFVFFCPFTLCHHYQFNSGHQNELEQQQQFTWIKNKLYIVVLEKIVFDCFAYNETQWNEPCAFQRINVSTLNRCYLTFYTNNELKMLLNHFHPVSSLAAFEIIFAAVSLTIDCNLLNLYRCSARITYDRIHDVKVLRNYLYVLYVISFFNLFLLRFVFCIQNVNSKR